MADYGGGLPLMPDDPEGRVRWFMDYHDEDRESAGHAALTVILDRLTTAEQERDKALVQLHYVPDDWRYTGRLRAAEARVEALWQAIGLGSQSFDIDVAREYVNALAESASLAEARVEAARKVAERLAHRHALAYKPGDPCLRCELDAALACPPQQPQKAGE